MNLDEFNLMTPEMFFLKLDGFREHKKELQQAEWERTRWHATVVANSNGFSKKTVKPQDLIVFDWERKGARRLLSNEEIKNNFEYLKNRWQ